MKYIVSYQHPHQHYIDLEFVVEQHHASVLEVQLPAWRPGRYELGNFAKNVQQWAAFDANGKALAFEKVTKDRWQIQTEGIDTVHIRYNYYANELNAGSTYLDELQLYINPVNCFLYVPDREEEPCEVTLQLPGDYVIACGLEEKARHVLVANDFQQLADSPFIASNSIQHQTFECSSVLFHLWFQGECQPDWEKIMNDFKAYTEEQIRAFGEFPVKEYHYLFQITPYKTYHGVEHQNSTVIALGPSYAIMKEMYKDFLGVSSHELYHTWNIKAIRPEEMLPYDFSKENYSRLGYVAEGVTTYYGDLMLFRSEVFSNEQYYKELNKQLQRHFDNFGRLNMSVADSSFDTWLDGYAAGVPNRKVSIYTEGCLLAFATDVLILQHTNNEKSLDDVMHYLYHTYAKSKKGYTETGYKAAVEQVAGASFDTLFSDYFYGTTNYEELLARCLDYIGCQLEQVPSATHYERKLGYKADKEAVVQSIYPNAIADKAGLSINDKVLAVNGYAVHGDLDRWSNYFSEKAQQYTIERKGRILQLTLQEGDALYYHKYKVSEQSQLSNEQKEAFGAWKNRLR